VRVIVDRDKCQDHGQCTFAAPDVFHLDDDGHLVYVAEPDDSQRESVEDASDVCPVQAITVEG
jgi:ferredoxin